MTPDALMARLRTADPAADATVDEATALRDEILRTARARPERPRRRSAFLAAGAAGVCAVALGGAAVMWTGEDPVPGAAAAQVLRTAARTVAASPSLVPGPGRYYYRRAEGVTFSQAANTDGRPGTFRRVRTSHELWVAADGSGRVVRRDVPAATGPGAAGELDVPLTAGQATVPFGSRSLTIAQVQALPTDPRRLAELIRDAAVRNSRPLAYQELDLVGELLRNAPVDPGLGAALYGALSTMPGVEALGTRTDQLGRAGQAVGTVDGTGARLELVVDPRTGRLLADRTVAVDDLRGEGLPFTPGDVMEEFTYVTQGVVDSTDQRVR